LYGLLTHFCALFPDFHYVGFVTSDIQTVVFLIMLVFRGVSGNKQSRTVDKWWSSSLGVGPSNWEVPLNTE